MKPELVADYKCHTGEGPLWHPDEKIVYWVDIPAGSLYRYDSETGSHGVCYQTNTIGGFTIQADGSLLLFEDGGRIERWDGEDTETVIDGIAREAASRFNDVIADPEGRVYCGTMPTEMQGGCLYRLDRDGSITPILEGVDIPNGMGFTPDLETFYFTESGRKTIYRFDYDQATGALQNKEVFVDSADIEGIPDGMTVDENGDVWSARWNGGCVLRYTSDGEEQQRISLPARKVSSITFGEPDYGTAYITTALGPGEREPRTRDEEGSGAGALFRVDLGVSGVPEYRSEVQL